MDSLSVDVTQMDDVVRRWIYDPTVGKLLVVALGCLVLIILVRMVHRRVINRFITDGDLRYRARKLVSLGGYLLAGVFAASVFSTQFSQLTVAFGIAGAGIAFALQEVIMSLAGWVALLFGDFYKTGDRIRLGGIMGDVIDIGVFRTMIMECGDWVEGDLYNGRMVRVANSYVFKEPVYNYSDDFPFVWDEISIPIRFGSDVAESRAAIARVAEAVVGGYAPYARRAWKDVVDRYRIEDARIDPLITMTFDENWITFTLRYVVDYKARRSTKDQLFEGVLTEAGHLGERMAIASSSLDINMTDAPPLAVRMDSTN